MGSVKTPKIAIIGAGVSGLRCADVLLQHGAKVTVFEARDRIGGRVHQGTFGGYSYDIGANWIHSPNENPILGIAQKTQAVLFERPTAQATFGSDGKRRTNEAALKKAFWDLIDQAEQHSHDKQDQIDPDESLFDFIKSKTEDRDLINESQRWGQLVGDPINKQSLKFLNIEEGVGGNDVFVTTTYKDILQEIARPVLKYIKLNTEVKNITTGPRVLVEGEEFDEVIVSCPLGYLKRNKDIFTPSLPPRISDAIDNIQYGRLEKLYLEFPSAFWLDHTCFTHFHHPDGAEPWPSNIVVISLAHMPGSNPTLLFYMHGPCGGKVVNSVQGLKQHSEEYNKTIDDFAYPYYSRLTGYDNSKPVSYFCSSWQLDPLAGYGSYSNFHTGIKQADKDVEAIREGLSDRHLWFIGEHTAPFSVRATTTGAYISGERLAERVCKRYDLKQSN